MVIQGLRSNEQISLRFTKTKTSKKDFLLKLLERYFILIQYLQGCQGVKMDFENEKNEMKEYITLEYSNIKA